MTITESTPDPAALLDAIDEGVRQLQYEGVAPRYVVVGPEAYQALREAIAKRFGRSPGTFERYQHLDIVVDPFRGGAVAVLPGPADLADGVRGVRV